MTFNPICDRIITDFLYEGKEIFLFSPLKLKPAFKDYLWGGTKLRDNYNKKSSMEKIAESWELSCHKDGYSVIEHENGTEETLADYIEKHGLSVLGTNCSEFENFPVLIKLIDAKDNLSVQVHPDNKYALENEGEYGKTEMWYIADCEEGASLLYGFKEKISKEDFIEHIKNNTLTDAVQSVPVKKGDVFFISAGTLHAIGKGIVIAEIQQNSNTTYRIYDYGRTDKDGNTRELHIDKACDVTNLGPAVPYPYHEPEQHEGFTIQRLSSCEYFTVDLLNITSEAGLFTDSSSFEHLLVLEGEGHLNGESCSIPMYKGDSIFIPAGYGRFTIDGNCLIIKTRID